MCWETWHNTNVSLSVFTNQNLRRSTLRADPEELLKSAICISCHQAWSSFRPAGLDNRSHSAATQCAQRAAIQEAQIKTLQTPSLYIFSVLVGDQKTTPPPVSTLCALSGPPHHLGFLYYCVGWLCNRQWGSWTTGAWAFSTKRSVMLAKGFLSIRCPTQWKDEKPYNCALLCVKKNMGAVVGSGSDNWSYEQWPNPLDQSGGATDWQVTRKGLIVLTQVKLCCFQTSTC